jgi:hypothetical protein
MVMQFPWPRTPWLDRAGRHSPVAGMQMIAAADRDAVLVFALLEAIDFECWKFGDAPQSGPTEEEAKRWLVENYDEWSLLLILPPSALGLFTSAFDFLHPEKLARRSS